MASFAIRALTPKTTAKNEASQMSAVRPVSGRLWVCLLPSERCPSASRSLIVMSKTSFGDEMVGCRRGLAADRVGDPEAHRRRPSEFGVRRHGQEDPQLAGLIG